MIKYLQSFLENLSTKTTNPYFGTLISVLILRNWKPFYAIFNFSKTDSVLFRISAINEYFINKSYWEELGCSIVISFGVLVASYTLMNFSRLIINFFEFIVVPKIYEFTTNNKFAKLVLRTEYNKIKDRYDKELTKQESTTKALVALESKIEEWQKLIQEAEDNSDKHEELASKRLEIINELKASPNLVAGSEKDYNTLIKSLDFLADETISILDKGNILNSFLILARNILNKEYIDLNRFKNFKEFLKLGLVISHPINVDGDIITSYALSPVARVIITRYNK